MEPCGGNVVSVVVIGDAVVEVFVRRWGCGWCSSGWLLQ